MVTFLRQRSQNRGRNIDYIVDVPEYSPEELKCRPSGVPMVSCNTWVDCDENIICPVDRTGQESPFELKFLDISKVPLCEDETTDFRLN